MTDVQQQINSLEMERQRLYEKMYEHGQSWHEVTEKTRGRLRDIEDELRKLEAKKRQALAGKPSANHRGARKQPRLKY